MSPNAQLAALNSHILLSAFWPGLLIGIHRVMASGEQTPPFKVPKNDQKGMESGTPKHCISASAHILIIKTFIKIAKEKPKDSLHDYNVRWSYLDMSSCLEEVCILLGRYRNKTRGCFHNQESIRGSRERIHSHLWVTVLTGFSKCYQISLSFLTYFLGCSRF